MARKRNKAATAKRAVAEGHDADNTSLAAALNSASGNETEEVFGRECIRLSFLIHDVSRMRRSAYDQYMKPLSITRAQWWVLAHLSRHDGMMQTQLADVLEVGKASLGTVIEKLETDGWVIRREDPTDRRAKRVYLTRPGKNLIARMTKLELDFNRHAYADIDIEERKQLIDALMRVKKALNGLNIEQPNAEIGAETGAVGE